MLMLELVCSSISKKIYLNTFADNDETRTKS